MSREDAYQVVQGCAHQAWNQPEGNFYELIHQHPTVQNTLSASEIDSCFDPQHHFQNLDAIYQRLGI